MATKKPLVVGPDGRPQQIQAGDVLSPADLGDGLALSVLGVTGGVDAPRADIIPPAGDTADQILMVTKGNALLEFIDPALADDPNGFLLLDAGSAPSLKSFIPITRGGTGQATAVAGKDALTVQGADIASAGTTNLANATGEYVHITGTTTITALGTAAAGLERVVKFTGILTLTHNGTSLQLPGAANITTAADDRAIFRSLGSGNWICVTYVRAALSPGTASVAVVDAGGDTTTWPMLATSQTGSQSPTTDAGLTYNATTNVLTATTFAGGLSGNANTASTLVAARLINGVSFNGSADITVTAAAGTLTGMGSVTSQIPDPNLTTGDSAFGYDFSAAVPARFTINGIIGLLAPFQARLTLVSNSPIPALDVIGQSSLLLTPFNGKRIALYSSSWLTIDLSEFGIVLSGLTSLRPYDVYVFYSAATPSSTNTTSEVLTFSVGTGWATGSLVIPMTTGGGLTAGTTYFYRAVTSTTGSLYTTFGNAVAGVSPVNLTASITSVLYGVSLELTAWTNDTTRATIISTQDGVFVKNGDPTRRLAGTIFTTSTSTTEDSLRNRYVANIYNAVPRRLFFCPGYTNNAANTSYTDSTATFKEANGSGNGNCGFITPLVGFQSSINISAVVVTSASGGANAGIGFDGITDIRAMGQTNSVSYLQAFGCFCGYAGLTPGKHAWYLCTYSQIGTATWFADGANTVGGGIADYPDTYLEGWMMG